MNNKATIEPPEGFKTWWDYAIATMDTRTLHLESCDTDTILQGDDFRQAAKDERARVLTEAATLTTRYCRTCGEVLSADCENCKRLWSS